MLYTLEQGPVERKIINQCLRERLPLPQAIQKAPVLWLGLELFFGAFLDLDGDRPSGWNMRPIPLLTIVDYAKAYNITGEQREDLLYYVRGMDRAYMKHETKKGKRKK